MTPQRVCGYNKRMVLLIVGMTCGFVALAAAVVLHFRLPGWLALSGLASMKEERRSRVAVNSLRRHLSILFYAVAAVFFAASSLLYVRVLDPISFLRVLVPSSFLCVNLVMVIFRVHDSNDRSPSARKSARIFLFLVNALFLCFFALLAP